MITRRTILACLAGACAVIVDLEFVEVAETATAPKRFCPSAAGVHPAAWPAWHTLKPPRTGSTLDIAGTPGGLGYDLERVRKGDVRVPRILVSNLPHDLRSADSADTRKAVFLATLLPAVLLVNEVVLGQRQVLEGLRICKRQNIPLGPESEAWLSELARLYDEAPDVERLMRKVDAVPPSLVLAQAAVESGWGTSRIAREGNALFGEYAYTGSERSPHQYQLRAFDHLAESVLSYVRNLNTHPAYERFRTRRAELRAKGGYPDSHALAAELRRYSARGQAYVRDIRAMIRMNDLGEFDTSRLARIELGPRSRGGQLSF